MGAKKKTCIVGLSTDELAEVSTKLDALGIKMKDLIEFLDRDKVVLFSEQKHKINQLERKLEKISGLAKENNG